MSFSVNVFICFWFRCDDDKSSQGSVSGCSTPQTPKGSNSRQLALPSTPTSSQCAKTRHIRRCALNFSIMEKMINVPVNEDASVQQCSKHPAVYVYDVPPDVYRPTITEEWTEDGMNAGYNEVISLIFADIPEPSYNGFVLRRRAAVLPQKCGECLRWQPPFYRCRHCGDLFYGQSLSPHEEVCSFVSEK